MNNQSYIREFWAKCIAECDVQLAFVGLAATFAYRADMSFVSAVLFDKIIWC